MLNEGAAMKILYYIKECAGVLHRTVACTPASAPATTAASLSSFGGYGTLSLPEFKFTGPALSEDLPAPGYRNRFQLTIRPLDDSKLRRMGIELHSSMEVVVSCTNGWMIVEVPELDLRFQITPGDPFLASLLETERVEARIQAVRIDNQPDRIVILIEEKE